MGCIRRKKKCLGCFLRVMHSSACVHKTAVALGIKPLLTELSWFTFHCIPKDYFFFSFSSLHVTREEIFVLFLRGGEKKPISWRLFFRGLYLVTSQVAFEAAQSKFTKGITRPILSCFQTELRVKVNEMPRHENAEGKSVDLSHRALCQVWKKELFWMEF